MLNGGGAVQAVHAERVEAPGNTCASIMGALRCTVLSCAVWGLMPAGRGEGKAKWLACKAAVWDAALPPGWTCCTLSLASWRLTPHPSHRPPPRAEEFPPSEGAPPPEKLRVFLTVRGRGRLLAYSSHKPLVGGGLGTGTSSL